MFTWFSTMIAVEHTPPQEAEIFAGLNNIIARSTSPKKSHESLKNQECSAPKVQPLPPKPKYQLWPNIKKTVSGSGRSTPDSGRVSRNPFKEGGLSRSHKISVPDLSQLATIDERNLDSPTIPGQYPIHERSNSAPGACAGSSSVQFHTGDTSNKTTEEPAESLPPSRGTDSPKNRPCVPQASHTDRHHPPNLNTLRRTTFDEPPEVPPKSPRLALRASNIPATSSCVNISIAPVPGTTVKKSKSHEGSSWKGSPNLPAQGAGFGSTVSLSASGDSPTSPPSSSNTTAQPCNKRSRTEEACQPFPFDFVPEQLATRSNSHRRGISHESVLRWGSHPSKKHVAFEAREDDPEVTKQLPDVPLPNFPLGIPVDKAFRVLPRAEIETLQKQAHCQAQKFEVLNRCDVKSLSRELRALQKRCDYLRETYNSLRAGRHSLHQRMILYLKSPRVSKFSREGILKQEEALFELDRSIDEWYSKLENAEQRRTLVRQKLLEHLAATLVLRESKPDPLILENRTYRDPSRKVHKSPKTARKDVESIKIYADAEIQALFANIEKDMERMANSESPPPMLRAVAFSPDPDKQVSA